MQELGSFEGVFDWFISSSRSWKIWISLSLSWVNEPPDDWFAIVFWALVEMNIW